METYKIIRMYRDDNKASRTIKKGLSLEEAQEHCSRDDTQKLDASGSAIWFDGYYSE